MEKFTTNDTLKINNILKSNALGYPEYLRFKGNAVEDEGKWNFNLSVICYCKNGEYEQSFYIKMQRPTKELAIRGIKSFIKDFQTSHNILKDEFIDLKNGKITKDY